MPQPNGYRKALRFMRHADKFGLPIITLVDTPGAYAGKTAEELGQVRIPGGGLLPANCKMRMLAGLVAHCSCLVLCERRRTWLGWLLANDCGSYLAPRARPSR